MDLDDIWDQPVAPSPPRAAPSEHATPTRSSPVKRRRTTLFLSSDSEGEGSASKDQPTYRARTPKKKVAEDIEALFDDLEEAPAADDDLGDLAPALDLDQLRKQADARHAKYPSQSRHQVLPSSSPPRDLGDDEGAGGKKDDDEPGGKKKPKQRAKLDEARLLGKDGFPALVKQAKHFQPRGKGHEVSDLNRLLQMYQFWAHKMYPKTPFNDSVQRIEKLCHSKRMINMVGVWRDEEKGLIHGQNADDLQSHDESSDSDDEQTNDKEDAAPAPARAQSSDAEDAPHERRSTASSPPPRPPSSASEFTSGAPDDDFDIDAMLREEEEARQSAAAQPNASSSSVPSASKPPIDVDDDEAMWGELHDFEEPPSAAAKAGPSNAAQAPTPADNMDEDEDMWDIVREMEQEQAPQPATKPMHIPEPSAATAARASGGPEPSAVQDGQKATNDEGWDEMYL